MKPVLKRFIPLFASMVFALTAITVNSATPASRENKKEPVIEKVAVRYWVIPLFAVTDKGKAVLDLKASDIRIKVNEKTLSGFTLVKRAFSRQEKQSGQGSVGDLKTGETEKNIEEKFKRQRNVFLVFDAALSSKECTEASRFLARKIVNNAGKGTRFFVMTIEPFAGLIFSGGGTGDKNEIDRIIRQQVRGRENPRVPSPFEVISVVGTGRGRIEGDDISFFQNAASKYYHRKSKSFFNAFESLYYVLNSVDDNKFVYLFSEGVSDAIIGAGKGGRSMYGKYMSEVAGYMGRCGAVLFIINPFTSAGAQLSEASGVSSLKFLAQRSGGKYLEGSDKNLTEKIENIHMAYYEVFFPAVTGEDVLKIAVETKRPGISVHTLSETEKVRTYDRMNDMEREFLALNLVSGNPMYRERFKTRNAIIAGKNTSADGKRVAYNVKIPPNLGGKKIDIYKVYISHTGKGKETRVEKRRMTMPDGEGKELTVSFKTIKPDDEVYFVFIDPAGHTASVHGMKKAIHEQPVALDIAPEESEEWATRELMKDLENLKKKKVAEGKKDTKTQELDRLLNGAADYCKKLKTVAFHYICKEKIVETRKPLTRRRNIGNDVANTPQHPLFTRSVIPELEMIKTLELTKEQIDKRVYSYRLLSIGPRIKEERYKSKEEKMKDANTVNKNKETDRLRFLSTKAIFGPITILDEARQAKYDFRYFGKTQLKGRTVAVIEAFPREEADSMFIYGKIWIDTEDFSVLKIKANPNSIIGYDKLMKLADAMQAKLKINLETEFFKLRDGIRFPTSVHFHENYRGGPIITKQRGSRGWMRTFSLTTYEDYMFFDVKTEVSYD